MRNGGIGAFSVVPTLEDNGVITKKYLRDLEAAIKQRTPVAGANIDIKVTDGGYALSATAGFTEFALTVCSNGEPATIIVLGKDD